MALIITATEKAKLTVKGLDIELPSVYARINWQAPANGKNLQYYLTPFLDKDKFKIDSAAPVTFAGGSGGFILEAGQEQSLQVIHDLVKVELEEKGFNVKIEL